MEDQQILVRLDQELGTAEQPEQPRSVQRIIEGDCLAHMRTMPAQSIDCIVFSPPYNLGKRYSLHNDRMADAAYLDWQGEVAAEVARLLKPQGHLFLNVGWNSKHPERSIEVFLRYRAHLRLQNRITWIKSIAVVAVSMNFGPLVLTNFGPPSGVEPA
jgi:site-specific DNA-methyltransferase (adenine-specific)